MFKQEYINFFLSYGYFPKIAKQTVSLNSYDLDYNQYSLDELSMKAYNLFINNIDSLYRSNELHLLPLSGGLDSRAILAGLLKCTEAKNIYAFTYGATGTLDYEIGKKIATTVGVNHIAFELQNYTYSLEDLLYQSNSVRQQTILFHTPPTEQIDILFKDFTVWSGILGDVVGGSAIPINPSPNLEAAKLMYIKNKIYLNKHIVKTPNKFIKLLLLNSINTNSGLSYDEKIIFTERFEKYYKPIIEFGTNKYYEPFLHNEFCDLMINSPLKYRKSSKLYYRMLYHLSKDIFSLPTKNKFGLGLFANKFHYQLKSGKEKIFRKLGLSQKPLNTNYQFFYLKYNTQKDFKNLIDKQLLDLGSRNLICTINIDEIARTLKEKYCEVQIIKALVSLEIHLKNGKTLPNKIEDLC
jgi:hypothetical protein